jgi:hypothetical protein
MKNEKESNSKVEMSKNYSDEPISIQKLNILHRENENILKQLMNNNLRINELNQKIESIDGELITHEIAIEQTAKHLENINLLNLPTGDQATNFEKHMDILQNVNIDPYYKSWYTGALISNPKLLKLKRSVTEDGYSTSASHDSIVHFQHENINTNFEAFPDLVTLDDDEIIFNKPCNVTFFICITDFGPVDPRLKHLLLDLLVHENKTNQVSIIKRYSFIKDYKIDGLNINKIKPISYTFYPQDSLFIGKNIKYNYESKHKKLNCQLRFWFSLKINDYAPY